MNGVHDMGGMHGMGPIAPEADEPLFHAPWEARVLAMTLAVGAWGRWTIDASRHERERIPGPTYLAMSYYEKWFTALIELIVRSGLASRAEIEAGRPADDAVRATPPLGRDRVADTLSKGSPYTRPAVAPARFAVGDGVRARTINPEGHTRLPRYARGRQGVISHDHGVHVFPDTNAHGQGEQPQRLYGVTFAARELWGEAAAPRDTVNLDLWDSYLDAV
jgi:nitrile hydratase